MHSLNHACLHTHTDSLYSVDYVTAPESGFEYLRVPVFLMVELGEGCPSLSEDWAVPPGIGCDRERDGLSL